MYNKPKRHKQKKKTKNTKKKNVKNIYFLKGKFYDENWYIREA